MRITLQETEQDDINCPSRKVMVEYHTDEMDIYEFYENLIKPALLAMTFTEQTIENAFENKLEEEEVE